MTSPKRSGGIAHPAPWCSSLRADSFSFTPVPEQPPFGIGDLSCGGRPMNRASHLCQVCGSRISIVHLGEKHRLVIEEAPPGAVGTVAIREDGSGMLIGPDLDRKYRNEGLQTYIQHVPRRCDQVNRAKRKSA